MVHRISSYIVLALISAAAFAGEGGKCDAATRECEQQIRQMLSGRRYLGVTIEQRNPGLVIKSVNPDGPAARAGLRPGDRLYAVNGKSVSHASVREFKQHLAAVRERGWLSIIILRNGAHLRINTRLEPYSKEQVEKILAAHVAASHTATAGAN